MPFNCFRFSKNFSLNPSAKTYAYPPRGDTSDTSSVIVSGGVYGNGTYNFSSAITLCQDGDFTIYPVDSGRPSFNAYSSNAWSGTSAHGESGDGINFIDPFPSGTDCATFYANQSLSQNTYLYAGDYTISFWITKRKEAGYTTLNPIKLTVNGVELGTSTPASTAVWTQFTYSFTISTSGLIPILFNGLNTGSACTGLDNIVITPTSTVNPSARSFNRDDSLEWYINKNSRYTTTVSSVVYTGDYTQIQMPAAIKIQYYSFWQVSATAAPTNWIVAGSNDGSTWTLVDSVTSHTPVAATMYSKQVNLDVAYSYFRFIIISQTGKGLQCRISQLTFHSKTIIP